MVPSVGVCLVGRDTGNTIPTLDVDDADDGVDEEDVVEEDAVEEDAVEEVEERVGEEDVVEEEDRAFDERPRLFRGPRPVVVDDVEDVEVVEVVLSRVWRVSRGVLLGGVLGFAAAAMSFHEVDVRNPLLWDGGCCVIVVINHVRRVIYVFGYRWTLNKQIEQCNDDNNRFTKQSIQSCLLTNHAQSIHTSSLNRYENERVLPTRVDDQNQTTTSADKEDMM